MAKITLTDPANFNSTALAQIATNHNLIEAAIENTLSRNGTSPNQMEADLDLNNNDLLNVGTADIGILNINKTRVYPNTIVTVPILDEDDFVSNSAVHAPSQQSAKAYVDNSFVSLKASANTWTGVQTITTTSSGVTTLKLESTSADANGGPQLDLVRTSASPAVNDLVGLLRVRGMNSTASEVTYANINTTILDPTAGSEDARLILQVPVAGAQTAAVSIANGMIVGAPTGSYQGTGTINTTDYYRNGTALSSTLFGVAVGDASGNLKVLNTDGAWTFATTATNTNVAGVNVGVWKTAHRIDSYDAATYSGNRTTMAILRGFVGSGENGPTRSDTALHLEAEQDDWLNTTVLGESDTLRVFMRKGANGDAAGILLNVSKVESASYGSLIWEASSSWVQAATGTTLRQVRTSTGHQGPAADLRGGGTGFHSAASVGDNGIAYLASQNGGRWTYPFLGADGYANGTEYFYVTGPAHASGKGQLYTSALAHVAGDVAAPAGGSTTAVIRMGNLATFGIYFGTGAPTVSAAKGSLYLRRDGTTTNNRSYINTDGGTTWTALTTAA